MTTGSDGAVVRGQNYEEERRGMVARQIERRGIRDRSVLRAMEEVPRHEFVPSEVRTSAYDDRPLDIGFGQTISQPYIVAFMAEQLLLKPADRVLEVGTGSGYQAAVLSRLATQVFSIEIVAELIVRATRDLKRLGYQNILVKDGDGYEGWPEFAPFDAITVAAALDHVPQPLIRQLRESGRMVIPVGNAHDQQLLLIEKHASELRRQAICPVRFVPFTRKPMD
ncbi:MAG: protein-L-isoaspartate(D-aspartate) O-methyltransferase [Verrucomicrobia bacterium]|nr:protein-L-isoaspartate(D-aspartate) O-methyltransferase [Verrucomicrobiota bacterium]